MTILAIKETDRLNLETACIDDTYISLVSDFYSCGYQLPCLGMLDRESARLRVILTVLYVQHRLVSETASKVIASIAPSSKLGFAKMSCLRTTEEHP